MGGAARKGGCGLWRRRQSVSLRAGPLPGPEGWCVAGTGLPGAPWLAVVVDRFPGGRSPSASRPPALRGTQLGGPGDPPPQGWPCTGCLPLPLPAF